MGAVRMINLHHHDHVCHTCSIKRRKRKEKVRLFFPFLAKKCSRCSSDLKNYFDAKLQKFKYSSSDSLGEKI